MHSRETVGVFDWSAAEVFRHARERFEAAAAFSERVICFRVAGKIIRLRFAGPALASLMAPAFAHLEPAEELPADLTICCWDDASTGMCMTEPVRAAMGGGTVFVDGPVRIAWEQEYRTLSAYSCDDQLALFRVPDARTLASWERGAPLRRILHWWASEQDLQLVHSAAVGNRAGGVLLVGRGGSGKSTTALACVGSLIEYAGDDYCLLSIDDIPRVHSLYGSGKADAASAARLPRLQNAFAASTLHGEGKSVIFVAEHFPDAIVRSFPLRAIVVPRLAADEDCRTEPLSKSAALRAVAPSTLFQMPGDRRDSLSRLTLLIRQLPCWSLTIGCDPAAAQPLLQALFSTGPVT